MLGLSSQSLWTLEMSLRGGRQPTWQPLSPHQAVADCDVHPRDCSMLSMRGNKLIKAIIAQMVCALFYSKAVSNRAQHLVEKMEKDEKGEESRALQYEAENVQVHIHSGSSCPYHVTPLLECVCVFVCLPLSVHIKS